ncbi:MAG: hypothetical protein HN833_03670 [Elusimicrobiaceae bacterium]|jgi:hypothetical protein|nr:hypothetical protein [Elusimicrobiaceae bacterium]MBT4402369.1 hypothetical protein [Elusimicrobiaceae bacterium]MBT4440133.1 hypothetical protein [Elusimicrobiaceae bacterium]MBT5987458.1 hypothetical protein [Elusimicrobiaceae bacterium]MBT6715709.1 hypothetical protein [Elusimicrobiaceae bacterium]
MIAYYLEMLTFDLTSVLSHFGLAFIFLFLFPIIQLMILRRKPTKKMRRDFSILVWTASILFIPVLALMFAGMYGTFFLLPALVVLTIVFAVTTISKDKEEPLEDSLIGKLNIIVITVVLFLGFLMLSANTGFLKHTKNTEVMEYAFAKSLKTSSQYKALNLQMDLANNHNVSTEFLDRLLKKSYANTHPALLLNPNLSEWGFCAIANNDYCKVKEVVHPSLRSAGAAYRKWKDNPCFNKNIVCKS